jgi:predicted dehydrogenase
MNIDQTTVDMMTEQIDMFMDLLGLTEVDSFYELCRKHEAPKHLQDAVDACIEYECALLTFSLTTLNPDERVALHLVDMMKDDAIEVYFVHAESTIKTLLK